MAFKGVSWCRSRGKMFLPFQLQVCWCISEWRVGWGSNTRGLAEIGLEVPCRRLIQVGGIQLFNRDKKEKYSGLFIIFKYSTDRKEAHLRKKLKPISRIPRFDFCLFVNYNSSKPSQSLLIQKPKIKYYLTVRSLEICMYYGFRHFYILGKNWFLTFIAPFILNDYKHRPH